MSDAHPNPAPAADAGGAAPQVLPRLKAHPIKRLVWLSIFCACGLTLLAYLASYLFLFRVVWSIPQSRYGNDAMVQLAEGSLILSYVQRVEGIAWLKPSVTAVGISRSGDAISGILPFMSNAWFYCDFTYNGKSHAMSLGGNSIVGMMRMSPPMGTSLYLICFNAWIIPPAVPFIGLVVYALLKGRRRRLRRIRGLCVNCGYDLRGSGSPRCPECGLPVPAWPPAQPAAMMSPAAAASPPAAPE